jgi:hypothetical protein
LFEKFPVFRCKVILIVCAYLQTNFADFSDQFNKSIIHLFPPVLDYIAEFIRDKPANFQLNNTRTQQPEQPRRPFADASYPPVPPRVTYSLPNPKRV